jgi:hypothetical protein
MDFHLDVGFQVVEITLNTFPDIIIVKARVFLIQEIRFVIFFVRNLCRLYEFLPLNDLSRCN